MNLFYLFLAGGLGSLSRYGLGLLIKEALPGEFPWSVTLINLLGCFAFGVAAGWVSQKNVLTQEQGLIVLVGFLGAFTTFSTFAYEGEAMIRDGRWGMLIAYLGAHNLLGILAVIAGLRLTR